MEDAFNTEEDDIVKETSLMEDTSSDNSFREGIESNSIKDSQSYTSEELKVDEGPVNHSQKDINVMEEDVPILNEGIDFTQYFKTDKVFDSREAVVQWCQEAARKKNTGLAIKRSINTAVGKGSVVELGCDRGGVYKPQSKKSDIQLKRKRETKKCGCPFKLRSLCTAKNKWNLRVTCGRHNHEVNSTGPRYPYFRRLSEDEEQLLIQLTERGLRPRQVLQALKEKNKENLSNLKTIYNVKTKLKLHDMNGRSVIQQVIKLSAQYHYMEWHRKDEKTGELKDVLWAHPESTLLAQCFPLVLMIDCTYKTNRFKIPFFHVAGVSSVGTSFTVAYAFIEEETEEHFSWILMQLKSLFSPNNFPSVFVSNGELPLVNAIGIVFPGANRLFCPLHIEQDILTNCKKAFENDEMWNNFYRDWQYVWKAETKEEYVDTYTEFVTTWVAKYPTCITYLRDTWLGHKESFILAWTQKVKHFGNNVINRVECERDQLKKCMESSGGSFFTCWITMHNLINNQIIHIKTLFERSLTSVNHVHQIPAFEELRNHVSQHALELIRLELNRATDASIDMTSCRCVIHSTHGLPCAHDVVKYAQKGMPVPLSAIDPQWKQLSVVPRLENIVEFDCLPEVQLLREKWIEASEPERFSLVEKMKDIALS